MSTMIKMIQAVTAVSVLALASPALAAGEGPHVERQSWSFAGPFGSYDKAQLQRGFKVYQEVCAACHSMRLVKFRNLGEEGGLGYNEDQVKAIAAEYTVEDGPDDLGDMFERTAIPSDAFPPPFPNDNAARSANGGSLPPDFSLLAKARAAHRGFPWFVFDAFTQYQEQGPDYIYGLLTGYGDAPDGESVPEGKYYNSHFLSGTAIGMAPPLSDEIVDYEDGTAMTTDQYSRDVAAFMMWAAEPHLDARKKLGFQVMVFLIFFAGLLYFTKKKLWQNVDH